MLGHDHIDGMEFHGPDGMTRPACMDEATWQPSQADELPFGTWHWPRALTPEESREVSEWISWRHGVSIEVEIPTH